MNWGFSISQTRGVDIDRNDMQYSRRLLAEHPELQTCIACGNCTATCTAGNLTKFNVRKLQTACSFIPRLILRRAIRRCGNFSSTWSGKPRARCPVPRPDESVEVAVRRGEGLSCGCGPERLGGEVLRGHIGVPVA